MSLVDNDMVEWVAKWKGVIPGECMQSVISIWNDRGVEFDAMAMHYRNKHPDILPPLPAPTRPRYPKWNNPEYRRLFRHRLSPPIMMG